MYQAGKRRSDSVGLGEICNMFNLTPRALRFYEEKGLIEPERNEVGWRSYPPETRRRLQWIAELRSAGVSLPDVEEVLRADESSGARTALALEKLAERAAALSQSLALVEALSERLGAPRRSIAA